MESFWMELDMVLMAIFGALKFSMETVLNLNGMAHLTYTPLPGSEKCIREPWRNAAAMLISLMVKKGYSLQKIFLQIKL